MSKRLIQDLHAGISRRDWSAVENTANRLRDDMEKTIDILAGTGVGSLPNDYPLPKLAGEALTAALAVQTQQGVEVKRLEWTPIVEGGRDVQAKTEFGLYTISIDSSFAGGTHYLWTPDQREFDDDYHSEYRSRTAAINAAQSDYETRIRSALVDVPAVESEPELTCPHIDKAIASGELSESVKAELHAIKDINSQLRYGMWVLKAQLAEAHPPRSLSNEGSEIASKANVLATSIIENFAGWEDGNGEEIPELQIARDILALSTRKGSSEGDGSSTITSGGEP